MDSDSTQELVVPSCLHNFLQIHLNSCGCDTWLISLRKGEKNPQGFHCVVVVVSDCPQ